MAIEIDVGQIMFRFPDNWSVARYDDWAFYRRQFIKLSSGIKAVDLLAIAPNETLWLIEVKDYRQHSRTKPIDLPTEIAMKLRDSLAGLLAAKFRATDAELVQAGEAVGSSLIRVVLHLELPVRKSKLYSSGIDPAKVLLALRKLARCIDPRLQVVDSHRMDSIPWEVTLS